MDLSLYKPSDLELWINKKYQDNGIHYASDMDIEIIASIFDAEVHLYDGKCIADWKDGEYSFILLNAYMKEEQRRERFFHELCHPIKHVGNQDNMPLAFKELQEIQASIFQLYAALPVYMFGEIIHDVYSMEGFENALSTEFRLTPHFVRKRLEQIKNRLFWNRQEKEWCEIDTDTSHITSDYVKRRQVEIELKRRERFGA